MAYWASDFKRNGYVKLEQLITQQQGKEICSELKRWVGDNPTLTNYGIIQHNAWEHLSVCHEILHQSTIGQTAAALLQAKSVYLFQDHMIWKPPNTRHQVDWHQDYSFWPLASPSGVTIWIALEDADQQNGCMSFIKHSHNWGNCQPTQFGGTDSDSELPPLKWQENQHLKESIPLKAGFAVAHHPLNCHMSPPNNSTRHRRAWSLTFVPTNMRWKPSNASHPYNYFLKPTPGDSLDPNYFLRFDAQQ